jgi:spermidine synthase
VQDVAEGLLREDGAVLTVARSASKRGELALRRRSDGTIELRVNGRFAMDSGETTSERALASRALAATQSQTARLSVVVGGLGLGFTASALLDDARVARVVVAEIEPDLVRWHRTGLVPSPHSTRRALLDDPRLEVVVADIREVVARQPGDSHDLVLLDVDNGPGLLLYGSNAPIYREPFLAQCARAIRPGGVAANWSASESPALDNAVVAVFGDTEVHRIPVRLSGRRTHYYLYIGRKALTRAGGRAG